MVEESTTPPESGRMSKSMLAYQQRAEAHDKFMVEQVAEYEIGRRHLANMMGEDPETFTQEDINVRRERCGGGSLYYCTDVTVLYVLIFL
ncbi:28S ribosomal protein S9, mitochondrial [Portunus trituberculatus]|uniref:28S ribosomal protein S9, mitochondrial n=1 Tax=Portunus trituberculatus TaxID=210409 RepID=A0A5B7CPP5_PORTR|nr:28S ribosomal protein S9, mitochondrial [Portunus trituberculatus]